MPRYDWLVSRPENNLPLVPAEVLMLMCSKPRCRTGNKLPDRGWDRTDLPPLARRVVQLACTVGTAVEVGVVGFGVLWAFLEWLQRLPVGNSL